MKRKIIVFTVWTFVAILLFALLVVVNKKFGRTACKGVEISIAQNSQNALISENDVRSYLNGLGDTVDGVHLADINIGKLEEAINSDPYVKSTQIYITINGHVRIDVEPRKPLARVQNAMNEEFYISEDGHLMKAGNGKTAYVLFANGLITDIYWPSTDLDFGNPKKKIDSAICKTSLYKIFSLARYIDHNDFLKSQIDQVYVDKFGELELIPKVGNHIIIFGDADNMQDKFEKLIIFYRKGLINEGWEKYDTINIKYKNQVVCS
ncbi:MAG: hypothetical protein WCM76_00520 [Bacteroidota bacterium]